MEKAKKPRENVRKVDIQCGTCNKKFVIAGLDYPPKFCPYCGSSLNSQEKSSQSLSGSHLSSGGPVTLIPGHVPQAENIQFSVGPYQIINSIGKGGMGEVFLAYDTTCGRRIALKRIRTDLSEHQQMHNRFLKEARITSQLTHPAIIPIYAIHEEDSLVYYTMPFVEGQTLKQIFKTASKQDKKGEKSDPSLSSIPALVRIFLSICQAIAYAHSKNVLHRDIKPENIIIGTYGEVLILDWGLAKMISQEKNLSEEAEFSIEEEEKSHPLHQLTHIGRVVGTVSYMAPERALGHPANFQTDIYSLGVILYQILTLRFPFQRGTLKEFRQSLEKEVLYDPIEVAPYRDVPPMLSSITLKCLTTDLEQRYKSVQELIHDLENYIEGRSEWFQIAELDIERKSDWEFQENVLIAEHIAITRSTEVSDWVSLMISKESFPENTKIETLLRFGEKGHGLGFLLSIPEAAEREHLNDGYCLWISSDLSPSTKLLKATIEVVHAPEIYLHRHEWYRIRIEKIDNNIHFYINNLLQFSYISHLPLVGTHIGLLSRDADFQLSPLQLFVGSQNVKVNCLAVPDAFLAHKDYTKALNEYRRIGYSFPGRAEGREAMFRAGVTLLEEAIHTADPEAKEELFEKALNEFGKMHKTPGAPLEYLGKALVYQTLNDYEEEIKCFELGFRRYPKHPLLPIMQDHILYRTHESSRIHRKAAYHFMLLVVLHLSNISATVNVQKLFKSLQKHWEPLYFMEDVPLADSSIKIKNAQFAVQLAFWLGKHYILGEIVQELNKKAPRPIHIIGNALFSLIELGASSMAANLISLVQKNQDLTKDEEKSLNWLNLATASHQEPLEEAFALMIKKLPDSIDKSASRVLLHLMEAAIDQRKTDLVYAAEMHLKERQLDPETQLKMNCVSIWACLLDKKWKEADKRFSEYSMELLNHETTPLHFLYGCWLTGTEAKEIADVHFSGVLEISFPRSWALASHYLNNRPEQNHTWLQKAFSWEKRQLYRQLSLYYHCSGDQEKSARYQKMAREQLIQED